MMPSYFTVWLWPPYSSALKPGVGPPERRGALRTRFALGRVAEERNIDAVVAANWNVHLAEYVYVLRSRGISPSSAQREDWEGAMNCRAPIAGYSAPKKNSAVTTIGPPTSKPTSFTRRFRLLRRHLRAVLQIELGSRLRAMGGNTRTRCR